MTARAALLAAGCLLAIVPPAAYASYPGRNGGTAVIRAEFDRGGESSTDLELLGAQGQVVRRAATCSRPEGAPGSGSCPAGPAFSPDGTKLAFALDGRLAVAAADGTAVRTLPLLTGADGEPYWSPDGTGLVFTGTRGRRKNLYRVRADGTGLTRLTGAGGRSAVWSRLDRIAYVRSGRIYLLDPISRRKRRLALGDHPDFVPHGRAVAYERRGSTYLVRTRRGARRRLLRRNARQPVVSPDGRSLLYLRVDDRAADFLRSLVSAPVGGGTGRRLRRGSEIPPGSTFQTFSQPAWQPR